MVCEKKWRISEPRIMGKFYPDDTPRVRPAQLLRRAGFLLFFFLFSCSVFAEGYTLSRREEIVLPFSDNSPVRVLKLDEITAAVSDLRYTRDDYLNLGSGAARVKYSTEIQDDFLYVLFIHEQEGRFPLYSAGSYIIKRSLDNGEFIQIKIFYKSDPSFFVRIFPNRDRTRMDVYLLGEPVYRGVNLPLPFEVYLTESFEEIIRVSRGFVDWDLLLPQQSGGVYHEIDNMIDIIRSRLPDIPDAEDGALDADGRWVSISTGEPIEPGGMNCSGFAKWVIDGIYGPRTGRYLEISELKKRLLDIRGNRWSARREYERDPYFGLDWTRNLAAALREVYSEDPGDYEAGDVTEEDLCLYREDIGYGIDDLPVVLYQLAVQRPGCFYLGSVNGTFGEAPPLRQHYHIALFFPVITPEGTLRVTVFERGSESTFREFLAGYPNEFVHLVEVRASASFDPPDIR